MQRFLHMPPLLPLVRLLFALLLAASTGRAAPPAGGAVLPPVEPGLDAVTAYEREFLAARWSRAAAARERLQQALGADPALKAAWARAVPSNALVEVTFWKPCGACTNGWCATCNSRKSCRTCDGAGACAVCKGSGGTTTACQACLCTTCRGFGKCTACRGSLWRECRACGGRGMGEQRTIKEACATCRGAGTVKSGIDGKAKTCPACRGAKTRGRTVTPHCAACQGSGRERCVTCAGKGLCGACAGRGRAAACVACRLTGRIFTACTACKGDRMCAACKGGGRCPTCAGKGDCVTCAGKSVLEALTLPAHREWLAQSVGILRIPAPPPGVVPRLARIPIRQGALHVVSDPAPPPDDAESGRAVLRPR